jgi:transcriptional regulator with XRE-family HTH domain
MIDPKGGFVMNQQKTGEFLKHLRKEKGLTQEQLAEQFYVSSRTVSRWETGSNMPDLDMLIELADYYNVDIREIIDGERKSEEMNSETKDTLKKVAEYAAEEQRKLKNRMVAMLIGTMILLLGSVVVFEGYESGLINISMEDGIGILMFSVGFALSILGATVLYLRGLGDKLLAKKANRRMKKQNISGE